MQAAAFAAHAYTWHACFLSHQVGGRWLTSPAWQIPELRSHAVTYPSSQPAARSPQHAARSTEPASPSTLRLC